MTAGERPLPDGSRSTPGMASAGMRAMGAAIGGMLTSSVPAIWTGPEVAAHPTVKNSNARALTNSPREIGDGPLARRFPTHRETGCGVAFIAFLSIASLGIASLGIA